MTTEASDLAEQGAGGETEDSKQPLVTAPGAKASNSSKDESAEWSLPSSDALLINEEPIEQVDEGRTIHCLDSGLDAGGHHKRKPSGNTGQNGAEWTTKRPKSSPAAVVKIEPLVPSQNSNSSPPPASSNTPHQRFKSSYAPVKMAVEDDEIQLVKIVRASNSTLLSRLKAEPPLSNQGRAKPARKNTAASAIFTSKQMDKEVEAKPVCCVAGVQCTMMTTCSDCVSHCRVLDEAYAQIGRLHPGKDKNLILAVLDFIKDGGRKGPNIQLQYPETFDLAMKPIFSKIAEAAPQVTTARQTAAEGTSSVVAMPSSTAQATGNEGALGEPLPKTTRDQQEAAKNERSVALETLESDSPALEKGESAEAKDKFQTSQNEEQLGMLLKVRQVLSPKRSDGEEVIELPSVRSRVIQVAVAAVAKILHDEPRIRSSPSTEEELCAKDGTPWLPPKEAPSAKTEGKEKWCDHLGKAVVERENVSVKPVNEDACEPVNAATTERVHTQVPMPFESLLLQQWAPAPKIIIGSKEVQQAAPTKRPSYTENKFKLANFSQLFKEDHGSAQSKPALPASGLVPGDQEEGDDDIYFVEHIKKIDTGVCQSKQTEQALNLFKGTASPPKTARTESESSVAVTTPNPQTAITVPPVPQARGATPSSSARGRGLRPQGWQHRVHANYGLPGLFDNPIRGGSYGPRGNYPWQHTGRWPRPHRPPFQHFNGRQGFNPSWPD